MARAAARMIGVPVRATRPYEQNFDPAMDLAPFDGEPRIYLIASTPRSGSHFLGHALMQTGHFGVPLEYLNARNLEVWRSRFRVDEIEPLFDRLVASRTSASGWFGLKAHWSQFAPYEDHRALGDHGGVRRAIFIRRADLLGQAISYLIARQTGQWIAGAPRRAEPRYDRAQIIALAEDIRAQNAAWERFFAERFRGEVRVVIYETLLANQERELAAIAGFLDPDCPAAPVVSERTRRQSNGLSAEWRAEVLRRLRDEERWIIEPQV